MCSANQGYEKIKPIFERRLTEMCPIVYNISVNKRERRERRKESKMREIENWTKVEVRENGTHKLVEKLFKEDWAEEYGADFEFDEIEFKRFTWTHIYCDTKYPVIDDLLDPEEADQFLQSMKELQANYKNDLYIRYTK